MTERRFLKLETQHAQEQEDSVNFSKLIQEFQKSISKEELRKLEQDHGYWFLEPDWYESKKFLTPEFVKKLSQEKTSLLSVGSGPALLERFLIYAGVPEQQITLSDIDPEVMPPDFNQIVFDATESWSGKIDKTYSYVIFPESFGIMLPPQAVENERTDDYEITEELSHIIKSEGESHAIKLMDDYQQGEKWLWSEKTGIPERVQTAINILQSALDHLSPGGEIRVCSPIINDAELLWIKKHIPNIHETTYGFDVRKPEESDTDK